MAAKRDFYEVLGVARDAAPEDVKRAYRKQAAAHHPDRNPGDAEAVERFKEAAEAFDVLGDPEKRALYDRYGHDAIRGRNGAGGFNDVNDIFSAFGEMFEGLFGGGGGRRSRAQRGENLRWRLDLDLRDAALGCKRQIEIQRAELCVTCGGSGARPGTTPEACNYCGGRGQIVQSQGFFRVQTTCPACRGAGSVVRDKCSTCSGTGREVQTVRLDVTVPAGVDNGMQLCLRGEGNPGIEGGPRGDLYCEITVAEHSVFKRQGAHLHCRVPITFTQAALGAEFEIPLIQGRHKLEIAAGTQPGEVVRVRGQGLPDPHTGRKGDLLIKIQVEVPRKMKKRQEELVRQLAEVEHTNVSAHRKSFFEKIKDLFSNSEETAEPAEE